MKGDYMIFNEKCKGSKAVQYEHYLMFNILNNLKVFETFADRKVSVMASNDLIRVQLVTIHEGKPYRIIVTTDDFMKDSNETTKYITVNNKLWSVIKWEIVTELLNIRKDVEYV